MSKKSLLKVVLPVAVVAAVAAASYWWQTKAPDEALKLYGSVDMRTVAAAFEESGKVTALKVEEGMRVKAGDLLATMDDETRRYARDRARGEFEAAKARLDMMMAGSRPEDIRAAKASLAAASAAADNALMQCKRQRALGAATSEEKREAACTKAKAEGARADEARERVNLLTAGFREEEKREAAARLTVAEASLALAERQLANCRLTAPVDGVVRARYKEKGDMVTPALPVFEIAVTSPLWARVWIDEVNLHKIQAGDPVRVSSDSYPDRTFAGTIGFISDVAEFTPRTVQTEALRTSLVYEVRVTVEDPSGDLRLGMPVTVRLAD